MGFKVSITPKTGSAITLDEEAVNSVVIKSDSPDNSQSRTDTISVTMTIKGKISTANDQTLGLPAWAMVKESEDWSATVDVEVLGANGITVRKMNFTDAFVVSYFEEYINSKGDAYFTLITKQNKEFNKDITFDGGF